MSEVEDALREVVAALPGGGEARPGQVQMAEAVADAITRCRHVVVQAGTGTGKSLGYLVPAVLSGQKTVIATATKNLQDQLVGRDLPFLAEQVPERFTFAALKGRSNYLCLQKAKEVLASAQQGTLEDEGLGDDARAEVLRLVEWSTTSDDGDRAGLDFEPSPKAWGSVSVSADECPGAARCPAGDACFAERARAAAASVDVLVVNTHLYGTHLAAGRGVLPDHEVVVFDETHQLEEILSATNGIEIGMGRFAAVARIARGILADPVVPDEVDGTGIALAAALADHHGKRVEAADVAKPLGTARARLEKLGAALRAIETNDPDATSRKARAQGALGGLMTDLDWALEGREGDVAWVEGSPASPVLKVTPVDVAKTLTQLFDDTAVVLTSATVPKGLAASLGMPPDRTSELDVGSPFDYEANAILYCAAHLPDPRNDAYAAAVADELVALITAAGGRTLALFTSWRAMQAALVAVPDRLDTPVLAQGQLPKPALIEAFAEDESASLFATMGFWQGIDVPGKTCVPPGTLVRTSLGYKPVENIEVGDLVWTHRRRYRRVTSTMRRWHTGEIVVVAPYGADPVRLTGEHPVLTSRYRRPTDDEPQSHVSLRWVPASELTVTDALALPVGDWFTGFKPPAMAFASGHRRTSARVRNVWEDAEDFWELVGIWAAEGSTTKSAVKQGSGPGRPRVHWSVTFSFSSDERETLAKRTCDLIESVLGNKRPTPRVHAEKHECVVQVKNDAFACWLRKHLGRGSADKRVPIRLLRCYSADHKKAFLNGLAAGDGYIDQRDASMSVTTASIALAHGARDLALMCGYTSQVHSKVQTTGFNVGGTYWSVRWGTSMSRASPVSRRGGHGNPFDQRYLVARPRSITSEPYVGWVYNLSVLGDESYTLPGFSVHNCSLVTVDRIPFPRPDDPLLQARRDLVGRGKAFGAVDLPRAITLLAQGAGRLIRTATDRGVVAVLDPRLAKAGYRWDIVRALPPMKRTRHREEAEAFLRELAAEPR